MLPTARMDIHEVARQLNSQQATTDLVSLRVARSSRGPLTSTTTGQS